ncbi:MAG: M10 family metallopeptidase, partial [Pseudomonadota bacterium]
HGPHCMCAGCAETRQENQDNEVDDDAPEEPSDRTTGGYVGEGTEVANDDYLSALVSGYEWDGSQPITFYLAPSDANNNGVDDWSEDGARTAMLRAFAAFSAVANITFQEVFNETDANLVENIVPNSTWSRSGILGDHFFPNYTGTAAGRYNIDGYGWTAGGLQEGGYGYVTILHEIGHGLGLEHPHSGDIFPGVSNSGDTGDYGLNQGVFTMMTYNSGWNGDEPGGNSTYGWQAGPMAFDIAALQAVYGANTTHASGNDQYMLPTSNGSGTFYTSIWDTGGVDEIIQNGSGAATINLTAATIDGSATGGGVVSRVDGVRGGFTIAQGVVIENAVGGSGNDTLVGNAAANVLAGRGGSDTMTGNGGVDVFYFTADDFSASSIDTITDHAGGNDDIIRIDGLNYDAVTVTGSASSAQITIAGGGQINVTTSGTDPFAVVTSANITARTELAANDTTDVAITYVDLAGTQSYSQYTDIFNVNGELAQQRGTYDSNGTWIFYYDLEQEQSWTSRFDYFNAAGQQTSQQGAYDTGGTWVQNYDPLNTQNYTITITYYDDAGTATSLQSLYDAGGYGITTWDPNDLSETDYYTTYYDANGNADTSNGFYDAGSTAGHRYWVDFDQNDEQAWATYTVIYDDADNVTSQWLTMDDGSLVYL